MLLKSNVPKLEMSQKLKYNYDGKVTEILM